MTKNIKCAISLSLLIGTLASAQTEPIKPPQPTASPVETQQPPAVTIPAPAEAPKPQTEIPKPRAFRLGIIAEYSSANEVKESGSAKYLGQTLGTPCNI